MIFSFMQHQVHFPVSEKQSCELWFLVFHIDWEHAIDFLTLYSRECWHKNIKTFWCKPTPALRVLKCMKGVKKSEIHFWTLNRICKYILSVVSVSKKYRKHSVICILWGFMIHVWMWFIYLCLFFSLEKAIHKSHLLSQTTNAHLFEMCNFF